MDYEKYVKGWYAKIALKGTRISFQYKWESAAVASQCFFNMNAVMNNNAVKLLSAVPDSFADKFEKGEPLELTAENRKYAEIFLRAQNYMRTISNISNTYLPPLIEIILQNHAQIDPGIYKYFIGTRAVLESYAQAAQAQVVEIDNSINASFGNLDELRMGLASTFLKTESDLKTTINKFAVALSIEDIIKVEA
jgi:hypothetical protein